MIGTALEREVLGALVLSPAALEAVDLRTSDFTPGAPRAVFSAIVALWEEDRPAVISSALLEKRAGQNGAGALIDEILAGLASNYIHSAENLRLQARELRRRALTVSIEEKITAQAKSGELDLDEIRPELEAYDRTKEDGVDSKPGLRRLGLVEPVPVEWAWPNYIPIGQATLFSGDPGDGKTWIGLDLAARQSRGDSWPDGQPNVGPASVVYLSLEDNAADTLRPRLDSLGGDSERVFILSLDRRELFDLSSGEGLKLLEREISAIGNVRLLVVDPILDFSGRVKANSAEEVRAFLEPLIEMARRLRFALVIVAHLNKDASKKAMYRTAGTTSGWLGRCRAGFLIFRDPDDRHTRIIHCQKANLAVLEPAQLAFTVEEGHVIYRQPEEHVDPDVDLATSSAGSREAGAAGEWLRTVLAEGPVDVKDIMRMASEASFTKSAVYRAKERLRIVTAAHGFGQFKTSQWHLPGRSS